MARLDDLEQLNLEMESFRTRSQETLKIFDKLAEFIPELSRLKKDFDSELKNASGSLDKLGQYIIEVENKWTALEPEARNILAQLKDSENKLRTNFDELKQEADQRWTLFQEDSEKTKRELHTAIDNLESNVDKNLTDFQKKSDDRYSEINQNLDAHSSRLDELKQEADQRWTQIQEDLTKAQNDLQKADRNLRVELGRMINELSTDSEGRFSEINSSIENQKIRFEETIKESNKINENTHLRLSSEIEDARQESEDSSQFILQQMAASNNRIYRLKRWLIVQSAAILILVIFIIYSQINP